ncbi:hypothetical protein CPB86DRAFT_301351 [Serendipita vermifera]|nr:hypothetical protein CPB86DRAFT_301351 [Serendipita vermifera]
MVPIFIKIYYKRVHRLTRSILNTYATPLPVFLRFSCAMAFAPSLSSGFHPTAASSRLWYHVSCIGLSFSSHTLLFLLFPFHSWSPSLIDRSCCALRMAR